MGKGQAAGGIGQLLPANGRQADAALRKLWDETDYLDLDPLVLYKTCPDVEEPTELFIS